MSSLPSACQWAGTAHDVLVTVGVPIGWHRAGRVDVAAFAGDPRRALFFAQTPEFIAERATADLLEDDDNRELAPVIVLGPDSAARYAVDFRNRVVRITKSEAGPVANIVGGPGEGYAVYDGHHQLVRREAGRLLGGWFRHATVEDDGKLWREDLATGERTLLGWATRVRCLDPEAEMVVQDAERGGQHDAAERLRRGSATQAIEGRLSTIAVPGTRNVIEICEVDRKHGFLRVL
jgi:hypothetical protein